MVSMLSIFSKDLLNSSISARLDIFKTINTNNIKKNMGIKKIKEKLLKNNKK